jgi:hypothetical protein
MFGEGEGVGASGGEVRGGGLTHRRVRELTQRNAEVFIILKQRKI